MTNITGSSAKKYAVTILTKTHIISNLLQLMSGKNFGPHKSNLPKYSVHQNIKMEKYQK